MDTNQDQRFYTPWGDIRHRENRTEDAFDPGGIEPANDNTPVRPYTPPPYPDFEGPPQPATAPPADVKASIADEAKRIVSGTRRAAYGTPEQNFERIARFWTGYMQNTGRDIIIAPADVSPMMRLMKEARLCETPDHRDSFVDLVGYALCGAEVNGVVG